jgi:hypothetical protein
MMPDKGAHDIVRELGRRYLWWKPIEGHSHSDDRVIAQTMNLGTYEDLLLLEQTFGRAHLANVMLHAEPGRINERSWEFWRGRLSLATDIAIPVGPPRRLFDAATS